LIVSYSLLNNACGLCEPANVSASAVLVNKVDRSVCYGVLPVGERRQVCLCESWKDHIVSVEADNVVAFGFAYADVSRLGYSKVDLVRDQLHAFIFVRPCDFGAVV
jgi:hypothetical protein